MGKKQKGVVKVSKIVGPVKLKRDPKRRVAMTKTKTPSPIAGKSNVVARAARACKKPKTAVNQKTKFVT